LHTNDGYFQIFLSGEKKQQKLQKYINSRRVFSAWLRNYGTVQTKLLQYAIHSCARTVMKYIFGIVKRRGKPGESATAAARTENAQKNTRTPERS